MWKPPEMTRCSLFQAVKYLAFGKEPDPETLPESLAPAERPAFYAAVERFVYLVNHEYGTGINVPLWGIPDGSSEYRRINLIFLLRADAEENRIQVREYGIRMSESVFAEEDARETVKTSVFNEARVGLDALKRLAALCPFSAAAENVCEPVEWEKLFFAMAFQNAGNGFAERAEEMAGSLFGRKIPRERLEEKIRRMKAEIKMPE